LQHRTQEEELLGKAKTFLMIPDCFHFLLTGVKKQEYTNASTTQLVNAKTNDWDYDLIAKLGYPRDIFLPIEMPGTEVGQLSQTIRSISVPAHDL
jgi:rhamnulokinase